MRPNAFHTRLEQVRHNKENSQSLPVSREAHDSSHFWDIPLYPVALTVKVPPAELQLQGACHSSDELALLSLLSDILLKGRP